MNLPQSLTLSHTWSPRVARIRPPGAPAETVLIAEVDVEVEFSYAATRGGEITDRMISAIGIDEDGGTKWLDLQSPLAKLMKADLEADSDLEDELRKEAREIAAEARAFARRREEYAL